MVMEETLTSLLEDDKKEESRDSQSLERASFQ
jgi:hypothetical protein